MPERINTDICVIGAGSAGLSVAAGASQMGARVVLVEAGIMGGDCLNTGCVPSKAMLAAAQAARDAREAGRFGIEAGDVRVDFARVNDHVKGVIAAIAPHDSVERFEGLGVRVIKGWAQFTDRETVSVDGKEIRARRFIAATGSSPLVPPIPGLDGVPYMTNETVFDNRDRPDHLLIVGGGPIGMELAQAHRRLGSAVTVLEMASVLPRDDRELAAVVVSRLRREGVTLMEGVKVAGVGGGAGAITLTLETEDGRQTVSGSHLLIAAGRQPNVDGLGLDKAGIDVSAKGIVVDRRLRTTNKKVYAIGDVAGGPQFTHVASYHAGIVIRNILFRLPAKADHGAVPWVTYTDPELAYVGLSEDEAGRAGPIHVLRWPYAENDRAHAERNEEGVIKVIVDRKGKVLGAGIVGRHAGELILPWVLALRRGLKIGAMADIVAPYPTLSEVSKRAAGSYFVPKLFNDRTRKLVRFLLRFG
jgi:pyruvate/2-oxoglutarate dehydrogenase complex dihydrolipoamide dehydrogenase (E3) component